ncbi:MAG: putative heme-binding domain-containing protein, partial [Pirellulaceae bacterium]
MTRTLVILFTCVIIFSQAVSADDAIGLRPRKAWSTSKVIGAPTPPPEYEIKPAFPHVSFKNPTGVEVIPGEKNLLVTEMNGRVYKLAPNANVKQATTIGNLDEVVGADVSLFSAILHPQFPERRQLFACYAHPDGVTEISRFTITAGKDFSIESGSKVVLLSRPSGPHNAGCLKFGKDGFLYASTGDGAGPNPPDSRDTGQDVSDLLGAILRIDVDRADGDRPYSIPKDNPFVGKKNIREEIWSYGLRNPWKFGIDQKTNEIFVADNGWETWESVHLIQRGGNCGWPMREGRAILRTDVKQGPTPIIPPIKDHFHTEANSVIGGPVYRGGKMPGLDGAFIYGDYITGTIWAVWPEKDAAGNRVWGHKTLVDTDLRIAAFAEGPNGELYVLDYDFTGQIYQLLPSDRRDTSASFPRKLSQTGLFKEIPAVGDLTPADGVVPYEVKVPRWMDGATAKRWIAVPGKSSGKVGYQSEFPDGTVLVKHLTIRGKNSALRLETQLLHNEHGTWNPYSYLWDDDGKEANLVDEAGAARTIFAQNGHGDLIERTWRVSAVNECRLCHNAGSNYVLGFVPNQLDLPHPDAKSVHQAAALLKQGVVSNLAKLNDDDPLALVDPHDDSHSIDDRARSYLHANCSMCHHPRGNAIVGFYLRRNMPLEKLKTDRGTIIGTFGMKDAKVIAGGDPYRSIMTYRMSKLGYGRMPYIGSQVVDSRGVALIQEWIRSLPATDSTRSAPLAKETMEAKSLARLDKEGDHQDAIEQLVKSTPGSLAVLELLHAGNLSKKDRKIAVAAGAKANSDIAGLFETFIPEEYRRSRLGPNPEPKQILSLRGDIERGKLIYYSDNARCRACHEHRDPLLSLGPTLADINKKYKTLAEIVDHVLKPSLKVEEIYSTYNVITLEGKVLSGLAIEQGPKSITLKTIDKKTVEIARDQIDELTKSNRSLMPERILSDLTAQE